MINFQFFPVNPPRSVPDRCGVKNAPVAQLDRASASGAEGHRFESCRAYHLPTASGKSEILNPKSEGPGAAGFPDIPVLL